MQAPDQQLGSEVPPQEIVQQEVATTTGAVVTRVESDIELQAPIGCSASVLVRDVTQEGGSGGVGTRTYATWLSVGRFQAQSITVAFSFGGGDVLRVDVPDGNWLDAQYLQDAIIAFLKDEGTLPPDPVIVKK